MKILFLGDDYKDSTSSHRAETLRRLGHTVFHINPRKALPHSAIIGGLSVRIGLWPFIPIVSHYVRRRVGSQQFDAAWVDGCPELSRGFYRWLKSRGMRIINYNLDDPFGSRDRRKWDLYKSTVSLHDITVVVRKENISEAAADGARHVVHVYRSYDPVAHQPLRILNSDQMPESAEVIFVGTWMPERGPFMARLVKEGVKLKIHGDRWQKATEWNVLKDYWMGPGIYGDDYVRAVQFAKVALGLLSAGNRDLHTQRSAEIPFIGGAVFCAERTQEHEMLYREGEEAVFWSTPEECAARCQELLADEARRKSLVVAAQRRVLHWRLSNDDILTAILRVLQGLPSDHPLVTVY